MKFINNNIIVITTLAILINLVSCSNNDNITSSSSSNESVFSYFNIDSINNIILYNGDAFLNSTSIYSHNDTINFDKSIDTLKNNIKYNTTLNSKDYSFYYTKLPVLSLKYDSSLINSESKIAASLVIMEQKLPPQKFNLGIEYRGATSLLHFKKSYNLELWEDSTGTSKLKNSLLAMRNDDDWILDGMWNEPLHLRDYISHDLWRDIARIEHLNLNSLDISREYCELFINDTYFGLYSLTEKIDCKQLDIDKNDGLLYKGITTESCPYFNALGSTPDNSSYIWCGFEVKYPKDIELHTWDSLYNLVDFIANDTASNYSIEKNLDEKNIIDYIIFVNAIFAKDNLGKNVYTARYNKQSPFIFLPWDIDYSWGNDFQGMRLEDNDYELINMIHYRLLQKDEFANKLITRWNDLRTNLLSAENLKDRFRTKYEFLKNNGVYEREALIENLSFNYSETEIDYIESFIEKHLKYYDQRITEYKTYN